MFDLLWQGKRHVMMGATQVDRFGNQNIACIGEWHQPRAQLLGFRGAPGNTINHTTSYWVPNHNPKVFVEEVDVVCGIGYDRAAQLGEQAARFHEIRRVVSNLGVFDFETPNHSMRLRSVHPGSPSTRWSRPPGSRWSCRPTCRPAGSPPRRSWPSSSSSIPTASATVRCRRERGVGRGGPGGAGTPFCELTGIRYPIVQTGMGWVAGATLTAATSQAGGMGILASATMTLDELRSAIARVKDRTEAPFGVNLLPNQPDAAERIDLMITEGVRLASFAGAPKPDMVAKLKDHGIVTMPTVGAPRHAEKVAEMGVDAVIAQGGEGGGHTGSVPTSLLLPAVCERVDVPVLGAGGFHSGQGLVAALAWGAAGIAMGTRFLLTQESGVPDNVKALYLQAGPFDTVVTTAIDGAPQRVIRTEMIDELEQASVLTRFPKAAANALRFRAQTGVSLSGPGSHRAGDEEGPGPHLEPGGAGSQRADARPRPRWSTADPRWASCRPARWPA